MESMTSMIEPVPSPDPGLYRFKVDLTDAERGDITAAKAGRERHAPGPTNPKGGAMSEDGSSPSHQVGGDIMCQLRFHD
jgi:hypothetical protein